MKSEVAHLRKQLAASEAQIGKLRIVLKDRLSSLEHEYQRAEDNKHLANANANARDRIAAACERAAEDLDKIGRSLARLTKERDDARAVFWELVERTRAGKGAFER